MALMKCRVCSAEIPDEADRCPKCGAFVVRHKWRCPKCGQMISKEPCPYCNNEHSSVGYTNPEKNGIDATTSMFTVKSKRNRDLLIILLTIISVAIIVIIGVSRHVSTNRNTYDTGTVVHGGVSDFYDDDGDGWVDRAYHRQVKQWVYFSPGEYPISSVQ